MIEYEREEEEEALKEVKQKEKKKRLTGGRHYQGEYKHYVKI